MTREEAIRILILERDDWETSHCSPMYRREAFQMAIEALKNSSDLISRQAAIAAFDTHADEIIIGGEENARNVLNYLNKVIDTIKGLPSARLKVTDINIGCLDAISRQMAIGAVNMYLRLSTNSQTIQNMTSLQEILEQLPSVRPEPKWIPCSERLPEKDTCFYLATIANHGLNFTTTLPDDVDVVRWDYDRRKGHNSWHWCTERTVIAWMSLPEPYQAERREE